MPFFCGDADFTPIVNDELYHQITDLAQNPERVVVYGVTYSGGDGIHDVHMNSGTDPNDARARDDRDQQDGAIAFYFNLEAGGQQQAFARWVFIKFAN